MLKHIFLVTLLSLASFATDYYVSATGSDSNSGTSPSSPWLTINHADAALTVGSGTTCTAGSGWVSVTGIGACVHVASGTYSQTIITNKSGSSGARIRYVSDTRYGAKLAGTAGSSLIWTTHGKYVDMVGFDFDGTVHPNTYTSLNDYVQDAPNNNRWMFNKIHDLASQGPNGQGGAIVSCGEVGGVAGSSPCSDLMFGNLIYHNGGGAASAKYCCNGNVGMDVGWGDTVQNNVIMDQGLGSCIQAAHNATNVIVTNNTIVNCNRGGITIGFSANTIANSTISNNIVANADPTNAGLGSIDISSSSGCSTSTIYRNNLLYPNTYLNGCSGTITPSGTQTGSNSTTFVNYTGSSSGDYHLRSGSTGIDTGTTACASSGCVTTIDLDFSVRPQGAAYDIGAYEFGGSTTVQKPSPPTGLTAIVH